MTMSVPAAAMADTHSALMESGTVRVAQTPVTAEGEKKKAPKSGTFSLSRKSLHGRLSGYGAPWKVRRRRFFIEGVIGISSRATGGFIQERRQSLT